MPLYEYHCDTCGHRFEKIQKFSDALESVCPKCGGVIRKLMSSPAIQFKGSGFYITDYAKKDRGGESKGEGKGAENSKSDGGAEAGGGAGKAGGAGGEGKSGDSGKAGTSEKADKPAPAEKAAKSEKPA